MNQSWRQGQVAREVGSGTRQKAGCARLAARLQSAHASVVCVLARRRELNSPPPPLHSRYLPCNITEWCIATNDFDCQQAQRRYLPAPTNLDRTVTGFDAYGDPALGACFRFELADFYLTAYRCALWDNTPTVLLCCCAVVLLCCCAAG